MIEFMTRGMCAVLLVLFVCTIGAFLSVLCYDFWVTRNERKMQTWSKEGQEEERARKDS